MASNRARLWIAALLMASAEAAWPGRIADVRNTPHNLSTTSPGTVKATTESQICVFCHTPHAATAGVTPLWNRTLSSQTYTTYTSSSLDANAIQGSLDQPGGSSKLCLSCHDGTLALGNVNVLNGQANQTITLGGTGAGGVMPPGSGATTGFTRSLGADLTNDHPISLGYTQALANRDGELRVVDAAQKWPAGSGTVVGVRTPGYKPLLPLEPTGAGATGQVQCGTCHDPHIRETVAAQGNQKFLRTNRFQELQPSPTFSQANDQICLGCHDKNLATGAWAYSAHANSLVATQTYTAAAAAQREFPANLPVWRAACLNCHDTHTVQGARRLLREGTDSVATPKAGGAAALEETCYQCHRDAAGSAITPATSVPNIRSDFLLTRRMPIRSADQSAGSEMHDIGGNFTDGAFVDCSGATNQCGKDFLEQRSRLGAGSLANRHAECTDCHNPHRVVKFQAGIRGTLTGAPDKAGTHRHEDAAGYIHSNVVSGVLRGAWGVEPIYGSASFQNLPTSYIVKRGDPGASVDTSVTAAYVTREYQICLKCHSDYGYTDDNVYPNSATRPLLGGPGLTPVARANDLRNHTTYTNQAKEFQAPATHAVNVGSVSLGTDGGAANVAAYNNNNHRSWHPVMRPTGRTGRTTTPFRAPWNNAGAMGVQTMYCSDCHGSDTTRVTAGQETAMPIGNTNVVEDGNPWGPHGSDNNWLLKGQWNSLTGEGQQTTGICFKCHQYARYAGTTGGTGWNTDKGDGHSVHSDKIDTPMKCNYCHVAVPHGWKNRGLLVNLNDVGPEVGLAAGTAVAFTNNVGYTRGPYYRTAFLRIISFPSGQWTEANCNGGSKDTMKTNCETPP